METNQNPSFEQQLHHELESVHQSLEQMRQAMADPVEVLPKYAMAQYKKLSQHGTFDGYENLSEAEQLTRTEEFQTEQKEIMDAARCERDIRNLIRFIGSDVNRKINSDVEMETVDGAFRKTAGAGIDFQELEDRLVNRMYEYRRGEVDSAHPITRETIQQAFESLISGRKDTRHLQHHFDRDPLLADLLASWVTGDSNALWKAAQDRMASWADETDKLKDPHEVKSDNKNHRAGMTVSLDWWAEHKPYVVNWERNQVVELRTSLSDVLSSKDGMLQRYFSNETHTIDTPLAFYAETDETTPTVAQIKQELGSDATDNEVKIEYQKRLWMWMTKQLSEAQEVVGVGHGFGANAKVARPAMKELLKSPEGEKKKRIGLALSTKGSEKTTAGYADGGHMDRAAWQIATALDALGIAGSKPLVWLGHSMGGQEALWLPIFAKKAWELKTIALTPVVSVLKEFLLLLNSPVGKIVDIMASLSAGVRKPLLKVGEPLGITNTILGYFINEFRSLPKDAMEYSSPSELEQAKSGGGESNSETRHAVDIHTIEFMSEYINYVAKGLKQLTGQVMTDEMMQMIARLYGHMVQGVVIGEADKVLHPKIMYDTLVKNKFNKEKLHRVADAPHYVFLIQQGWELINRLTNDGFKSLQHQTVMAN